MATIYSKLTKVIIKANGLSVSMSSLETSTKPQANYLKMKPILWQKSHAGNASTNFAAVNKQRSLLNVFNNEQRARSPSSPSRFGSRILKPDKTYEHIALAKTGSASDVLHGQKRMFVLYISFC
ncbi:PREDICTED: uncharacterized protein LOC108372438 [Rhagoletis zephyria]|uniref:uncharacterized protein LOC108372438 n=1 Tax=Rhagoletis zephyria TaxID=28612 RepID=UPI0008112A13|nr:PREDICTED: uncharacterized protein LOC108372438 [Rhagoletis zephyria]